MKQDIEQKVIHDFNKNEADIALQLLDEFEKKNKHSPRITRCIVAIANGNLENLNNTLAIAEYDWRDVILEAEKFNYQYNFPFK
jgi:hypothetical protein